MPAYAVIGAVTGWGMCFPHLLARPHVFTYPLVVLWTAGLVAARKEDRAPSALLLVVMVLWANVHASFLFGIVLVALFAADALIESSSWHSAARRARQWSLFGALVLTAALVTPHGIAGIMLPIDIVRMDFAMSSIAEWMSPNFQHGQPLEFWLMLVLLGALLLGVRLPIMRIAIVLVLLHMALLHLRHGELLGLIAPLVVAPALAPQLPRRVADLGIPGLARLALPPAAAVTAAALVLAVGMTVLRAGFTRPIDRFTPSAALANARQHQVAGPVFNDFGFGGFLIFSGIPAFIDGRVDLYGDEFLRRHSRTEDLPRLLEQYKISWTLVGAGTSRAVLMDYLPEWQRIYADDIAVVHVRRHAAE